MLQPTPFHSAPGALLRVQANCPRCGTRPALRLTKTASTVLNACEANTLVATVQCQRRGCSAIYEIRSQDCVAASEDAPMTPTTQQA